MERRVNLPRWLRWLPITPLGEKVLFRRWWGEIPWTGDKRGGHDPAAEVRQEAL